MINIRRANERGNVNLGWLNSYHTFSFGNYYDPEHMGFGKLRVINEDWVTGGEGFGSHPHGDMEIITYVLEGALKHKDSMGNSSVIKENDFQKMSAGTGVVHSEYNNSETEPVHLYQIWILPDKKGVKPSYNQLHITKEDINGKLNLIATGDANGKIHLNQDAKIYISSLHEGDIVEFKAGDSRDIWVQVIKGKITLSGIKLAEGDGASVENESKIEINTDKYGEVLLFDMAH